MPSRDDASRRANSDAPAAAARSGPRPQPDYDPTRPTSRNVPRRQPETKPDCSSSTEDLAKRHVKLLLPEMQRRSSESRAPSVPYPSFSKQHSREAVRSLDSIPSTDPFTPQPTNLSEHKAAPSPSKTPPAAAAQHAAASPARRAQAPPSPPLTALDQPDLRRAGSGNSMRQAAMDAKEHHARRKSADNDTLSSLRQAEEGSGGLKAASARPSASSKSSLRSLFQGRSGLASGKKSPLTSTPAKKNRSSADPDFAPTRERRGRASRHDSADDQTSSGTESAHRSRENLAASSQSTSRPVHDRTNPTPAFGPYDSPTLPPPPPPPPPPPAISTEAPRVDYLLHNGGLAAAVPKDFASAYASIQPQQYQHYMSPKPSSGHHVELSLAFDPFSRLLDNYSSVMSRHGSLAVATGYKSVARRLLDRLENVFSRNISSERCECALCRSSSLDQAALEDNDDGVSWGEVLELVSGRRELPPWPPFSLPTLGLPGLGILASDRQAPMQKLDIDVPEEYREHYVRQSKKTKQAVDKWLAGQPEDQPPPPHEVDDETMIFAMLTYLEADQRRGFTALLRGLNAVPDSRAPTPAQGLGPKSDDLLTRTGLALTRLYRLARQPRDPECAMFLLKNRGLHSALATLAAISQHEWDILISGRFDGFLWSGAEEQDAHAPGPADGFHKGAGEKDAARPHANGHAATLPFRAHTPSAAARVAGAGPVQLDEETEIAVLSEVEREIYLGMEALEDAFETLHGKAESVRNALLQRSAGLAMQAQRRRGNDDQDGPQARMGTPAAGLDLLRAHGQAGGALQSHGAHFDGQDEDEIDDGGMLEGRSELAPDDSASNVGWREREKRSQQQRYKKRSSRRTERRTPAPVEEVDEDEPAAPPATSRSRR